MFYYVKPSYWEFDRLFDAFFEDFWTLTVTQHHVIGPEGCNAKQASLHQLGRYYGYECQALRIGEKHSAGLAYSHTV